MSNLSLYHNDVDWVIARDVNDAWILWGALYGEARHDYEEWHPFARVADDKLISIWCDEHGNPVEQGSGSLINQNAAAWVCAQGRGFLGSLET